MKTVYIPDGKYVITDKILALIGQAVQRVDQLSKEAEWIPSFEIYIPYTRYVDSLEERQGMRPTGQVIIKIKPDSDVEDSAPENVSRRLLGQLPTGKIKVDIGEYSHEGWESLIDYDDLRELPDPYFTIMFLNEIVEPFSISSPRLPNLDEIETNHWKTLTERLYEEVKGNLEECDYTPFPEHAERAKKLKSVLENYFNKKTSLENLIKTIKEFP